MKFYIAVDCEGPACVGGEPGKGLGSGETTGSLACRPRGGERQRPVFDSTQARRRSSSGTRTAQA